MTVDLNEHFIGYGAKLLSAVEVDGTASNQHELNGVRTLAQAGLAVGKSYPTTYFYFSDDADEPVVESDRTISYYDSRANHPTRSEIRLYYPVGLTTIALARPGDLCLVALQTNGDVLVVVAARGSAAASRLDVLFNLNLTYVSAPVTNFLARKVSGADSTTDPLDAALLEHLGIIDLSDGVPLDEMSDLFDGVMPTVNEFTQYARGRCPAFTRDDDADVILTTWWEHTLFLFTSFDDHLTTAIVDEIFSDPLRRNAQEFYTLARQRQNSRFSRAGKTLESHLKALFDLHLIDYADQVRIQGEAIPDFLFPGRGAYIDPNFPADHLTMLAAKTSLKERWAQVADEAPRISPKHILTLEKRVPRSKTDRMKANNMRLVVPRPYQDTYADDQRQWLMSVSSFIDLVASRQP